VWSPQVVAAAGDGVSTDVNIERTSRKKSRQLALGRTCLVVVVRQGESSFETTVSKSGNTVQQRGQDHQAALHVPAREGAAGAGRRMSEEMEQAGREVWYVDIPHAGQSIGGASPHDLIYAASTMVEFFHRL
jgi:hypothetical protein